MQGHLAPSDHLRLRPASHLTHSSHCSKHSRGIDRFPVPHHLPPRLWSQQHFGGEAALTSPQPRNHREEATSSSLRSWPTLEHQSLSPRSAQSMFNIPPLLSALQGDPELPGARCARASRAARIITRCSTSLGLPTVFLPFPSINMDAQLLLQRGAGCKALLPVLPAFRRLGGGGSGIFSQVPGSGVCEDKRMLTNSWGKSGI